MQTFGRRPDLQKIKLAEVASESKQLGDLLAVMLQPDPGERISATKLAALVSQSSKSSPDVH